MTKQPGGEMQRFVPILGEVPKPQVVPRELLRLVNNYREACRLCWTMRASKGMTLLTLAERSGFYPSHRSDYFHVDDTDKAGRQRRSLPAEHIRAVEMVCGNTAISQWLAQQAGLTILEEVQQVMRAA